MCIRIFVFMLQCTQRYDRNDTRSPYTTLFRFAMRKRKETGFGQPGSWKQAGGGSEFVRRRGLEVSRQPLDQIAAERRGPIGFVRDIIDVEAEGDRRFARRDDIARAEIEARPFGELERVGQVDQIGSASCRERVCRYV